jgi:flagellar protein FlaF
MSPAPGYGAYARTQNVTESSREVEYRLLAQVTGAMIKARENPDDFRAMVDVALWNRSVWAAFRDDLSHPQNGLPVDLKARLISLSLWVDRETFAVLSKQTDMEAIIDVNRMVMDGLRASSAQASVAAVAGAPAPVAATMAPAPAPTAPAPAPAPAPTSVAAALARL